MFNRILKAIKWGSIKFGINSIIRPSAISPGERQHRLSNRRIRLIGDPVKNAEAIAQINAEIDNLRKLDPTLSTKTAREAERKERAIADLTVRPGDSAYTRFRITEQEVSRPKEG